MKVENVDAATVTGFGDEWTRFDQSSVSPQELEDLFAAYFVIFPWHCLPPGATGMDVGCGSGRWAGLVAPRVGHLHCIDPSPAALGVARRNLRHIHNCEFHESSANQLPLEDNSMDFGYSLGVLHHVPDTEAALRSCVSKLKTGAPFLLYLYYSFDNRPGWFRKIWILSDNLRRGVSRLPFGARYVVSRVLAAIVYYPLARTALLAERAGVDVELFPLSLYRKRSFYTMSTDALDRFGTRLERRFTKVQVEDMMRRAGLSGVRFNNSSPYWCALGYKVADET